MGMMLGLFDLIFGGGRNALRETAEVFRENSEAAGQRDLTRQSAALGQFAAEFLDGRRGPFDRLMDAVNRLPRPMLALGCLALFAAAMWDPVWFAQRMQGIALIPEPLWWLLGVVVSFYFGARHQAKGQAFQRDLAATLARTPQVVRQIEDLQRLETEPTAPDSMSEKNPALSDWRAEAFGDAHSEKSR